MADGGLEAVKALVETMKRARPVKCKACDGKSWVRRDFLGLDEDGQPDYEYLDCPDCPDVNGAATGWEGGRKPFSLSEAKLLRAALAQLHASLSVFEKAVSFTDCPLHNEPDSTPLGNLLQAIDAMKAAVNNECADEVDARRVVLGVVP